MYRAEERWEMESKYVEKHVASYIDSQKAGLLFSHSFLIAPLSRRMN